MNSIDEPLLVVGAPRRHGKSTIYSLCLPIYRILFSKTGWRFQIISQTSTLAEYWIREIMREFETNEWILSRFGNLQGEKWTATDLTFSHKANCRISGIGMGFQVRGFGWDEIVVDDPQSDEQADSEAVLEDHRTVFDKAILNTLEPGSKLKFVGTPINDACLLMDLITQRDDKYGKFKHLWFPAMPEDLLTWAYGRYLRGEEVMSRNGEVLFPGRWTLEMLMEKRSLSGGLAFDSEYMLSPKRPQDYIIKKEWIKYEELNGDKTYKVAAFDPAVSEGDAKSLSFSALCMTSLILDGKNRGKIHVTQNEKRKVSPDSQGKWIVDFHQREKPQEFWLEDVAYQKALKSIVDREARERMIYMPTPRLVKPDKDKRRRLEAVSFLIENGSVVFSPDLKDFVENELLRFSLTNKVSKDRVDAFVYCLGAIKDRADGLVKGYNRIRVNQRKLVPQEDTGRLA